MPLKAFTTKPWPEGSGLELHERQQCRNRVDDLELSMSQLDQRNIRYVINSLSLSWTFASRHFAPCQHSPAT